MSVASEKSKKPIRFAVHRLYVVIGLAFCVETAGGKTFSSADARVLGKILIAVELFLENSKHVPTNWWQLSESYDFTPANLALSLSTGKHRTVQQEYAIPESKLKLPDGREILVIQRRSSSDVEGNVVRRYVWLRDGTVGASTSAESSMPAEVRGARFPEVDPSVVKHALEALLPELAKERENRRMDRLERLYWLRNQSLSSLFGRDVAIAPDGTVTLQGKVILFGIVAALIALALQQFQRSRSHRIG